MSKRMGQQRRRFGSQGGLSLVELLVAVAISLVLMGGVYKVFVGSTRSYAAQQALARLQENGRFAIDFLTRDIRLAGYQGCLNSPTNFKSTIDTSTDASYAYIADFSAGIQGFDFQDSSNDWSPSLDASFGTLVKKTDALTIRGIVPGNDVQLISLMNSTTADLKVTAGSGIKAGDILLVSDCQGAAVFQVTGYNQNGCSSSQDNLEHQLGTEVPGNYTKDLGQAFAAGSEIFKYRTTSYCIKDGPDGNPGLYRIDYPPLSGIPPVSGKDYSVQELLEGVENMQIRYGVAASTDKTSPVTTYDTAKQVAALTNGWAKVKSVQIALLLRTLDPVPGVAATTKTYSLLGYSYPAPADGRLRRVFVATIALRNRLQ